MIKYEDITHTDGLALFELWAHDSKGGDLRPQIWEAMYGDLRRMLSEAASHLLLESGGEVEMSKEFPMMPKALEAMAFALSRHEIGERNVLGK